jgi:hypothetical protein
MDIHVQSKFLNGIIDLRNAFSGIALGKVEHPKNAVSIQVKKPSN